MYAYLMLECRSSRENQMDFDRRFETLFSFAISVMLSSGFLATAPSSIVAADSGFNPRNVINVAAEAARSAGVAMPEMVASAKVPTPTPVTASLPTPQPPVRISPTELETLRRIRTVEGKKVKLKPFIIDGLRIQKGPEDILAYQLAVKNEDGVFVFIEPVETVDGYIFGSNCPDGARAFLVDKTTFAVKAAALRKPGNENADPITGPTIQNEANAIITVLVNFANKPGNLVGANRP
jgi:hypothetical protein